jgi:uncharacterized protein YegP (UPF0339 family)
MAWSYTVRNDQSGQPRWWLSNGSQTEAYSGESFSSHSAATAAAQHFKANASAWNYVTFQGTDSRWYWHARASNNKNVAASGRGFSTQALAAASASDVRTHGGSAIGP